MYLEFYIVVFKSEQVNKTQHVYKNVLYSKYSTNGLGCDM